MCVCWGEGGKIAHVRKFPGSRALLFFRGLGNTLSVLQLLEKVGAVHTAVIGDGMLRVSSHRPDLLWATGRHRVG